MKGSEEMERPLVFLKLVCTCGKELDFEPNQHCEVYCKCGKKYIISLGIFEQ
jgi:hypothetical protein